HRLLGDDALLAVAGGSGWGDQPELHDADVVRLGFVSDDELARAGAQRLTELSRAVGIPRFRDLPHVEPEDFPRLAAASLINGSTPSNARELTEADYLMLLGRAYGV
ncbi:iron-containing alcohol dehydrogenase, partial [Bradyrhizobium sp. NBAIM08]|uniref:iron-containing alcohol dehydrogenase n=1 Tax=Bradyrhizobium sp. NBAIM08 TaxID=2793815 RepID=UPI001CD2059C